MTRQPRRPVYSVALVVIPVLGLLACAVVVAPNQWDTRRGPVVPHDSFPEDCSLCHTSEGWHLLRSDFSFDHGAATGLVLAGAHAGASCLLCHNDRGPVQSFSVRGCAGCHVDPHQGHLGGDCTRCHDENTWHPQGAVAEHQRTRFPLIGAHAAAPCFRCHAGAEVGNFQRADVRCEGCHQSDLSRATSPDHLAMGWTSGCERCHIPTAWQDEQFFHTAAFPLTGAHAALACESCHVGGVSGPLPSDCVDCHLAEYTATTDPNHVTAGFSTDCRLCHKATTWESANFNHSQFFALTGAHGGLSCESCHVGGVFAGLRSDCQDCHLSAYMATTNPNHVTAGFPTQCDACHQPTSWQNAQFSHSFPLSGDHGGFDCTDCHLGGNFNTFTCTSCHAHTQGDMDDEHDEVGGYVYSSPACLSCHPDGND